MTQATVIKDSISDDGHRLTTIQVTFHRFVLAEMNTHRAFSRNSASSRAIPLARQIHKVEHTPAFPVVWPAEQKGMQGGDAIGPEGEMSAEHAWLNAADDAVISARRLGAIGVHKSIANRLLEPFQMHTAVISATDWEGFWEQRCSPLAQPEIRVAAEAMKAAHDASDPQVIPERFWHLPYIDADDIAAAETYLLTTFGVVSSGSVTHTLVRMSTARCARVSYETQDGRRDVAEDLALYDRLVNARPAHWSPLEHVATPWRSNVQESTLPYTGLGGDFHSPVITRPVVGNFLGWRQHRFEMEST